MRCQTIRCQSNCLLTKAFHGRNERCVYVAAWSAAMWALLDLVFSELGALQLQNTLLTNHFFALITHLCIVQFMIQTDYAIFDFVFDAELREEPFFALFFRLSVVTFGHFLSMFEVVFEVVAGDIFK